MEDNAIFALSHLLAVGPFFSRYEGTLADGMRAEICLLRFGSEADGESDFRDAWLRRLRLATLLSHPNCRSVMSTGKNSHAPFVVMPRRDGPTLAEVLQSEILEPPAIDDLARAVTAALVACENIGLVVGGVTWESIHRNRAGHWQLDVSGLRSVMFGAVKKCNSKLAFVPPEFQSQTPDAANLVLLDCDSSADIYSFASALRQVIATCNLTVHPVAKRICNATSDCMAIEPAARPTARDLLKRLVTEHSLAVTGDSATASSNNFEATMNVEVPIEVPAGMLVSGTQLGRYTIGEKLGAGGMGAVYRAHDAVDGKSVAIKILHRQVAQDSITARRFAKEARLLARANNPYVANLFEVNSDATLPYLVVEFVDGGTLGETLRPGKPFAEKFALTIITDAVRGLAIAHARGVVHRDFKPDNVLLTKDAREWMSQHDPYADSEHKTATPAIGKIYAKVSDFGLARTAQQTESMAVTRAGALLGTPLYMSPEQCRGEPAHPPADVYSVGVTLFQLLSGRPPFDADTQVGLMNQHCHAAPPSLKQLRPQLSDALVRTIENCLAKSADARYADAGALLVDLENILRGEPTSLGLHPPILALSDLSVLRFEHAWELVSSPSQLWPFIANTDRVNHALGLPAVTYTTRQDPVNGPQRFAEIRVAGQRIRWQEHPYEWLEGRRFSVLREFTHGPFRWFVNVVELKPTLGGGTRVVQTLSVTPRNWLSKQLARLQLGRKSRIGFGRAYQQIDAFIIQSASQQADRDPFASRTELRPSQRQKLHARLEKMRDLPLDPRVIDVLGQFLEHASDLEVARIRPLALAERFQLDPDQVVNACLYGTRLGVFRLLWDIMCPSCRIPADIQETLTAIKDHGFCEACNLNFAIDLADSIELIFRAHPEIREVVTATYCIGGPAWSRHVVAQVRLVAGERFACELNLAEGAYILRGTQLPFTVTFQVGHTNDMRRIELSLARPPAEACIRLPVGSQVIHLCNDSPSDQQIRIERVAARHDALSAAKASTSTLFRELFPGEVLATDQIVSVAHISVMRVQLHGTQQLYETLGDGPAFAQIRRSLNHILQSIKEHSGAVVKTIGEGFLAVFADPLHAFRAATEMFDSAATNPAVNNLKISAAIHSGTALVATLDDRLDYFGKTLQCVEQMINAVSPSAIYASTAVTELPEIQEMILERGWELEVVPELCNAPIVCQRISLEPTQFALPS